MGGGEGVNRKDPKISLLRKVEVVGTCFFLLSKGRAGKSSACGLKVNSALYRTPFPMTPPRRLRMSVSAKKWGLKVSDRRGSTLSLQQRSKPPLYLITLYPRRRRGVGGGTWNGQFPTPDILLEMSCSLCQKDEIVFRGLFSYAFVHLQ